MIFQEFYCTKSGGGCGGYFTVPLNEKINYIVEMVCPNCGHKHQRSVVHGAIKEDSRFSGTPREKICPNKAAWSPTSRANEFSKKKLSNERDGAIISSGGEEDHFLRERWFEKYGGVS